MKFLKRLALLTLIFTMCVSTTTYACPNEKPGISSGIVGFTEMENGKDEEK